VIYIYNKKYKLNTIKGKRTGVKLQHATQQFVNWLLMSKYWSSWNYQRPDLLQPTFLTSKWPWKSLKVTGNVQRGEVNIKNHFETYCLWRYIRNGDHSGCVDRCRLIQWDYGLYHHSLITYISSPNFIFQHHFHISQRSFTTLSMPWKFHNDNSLGAVVSKKTQKLLHTISMMACYHCVGGHHAITVGGHQCTLSCL